MYVNELTEKLLRAEAFYFVKALRIAQTPRGQYLLTTTFYYSDGDSDIDTLEFLYPDSVSVSKAAYAIIGQHLRFNVEHTKLVASWHHKINQIESELSTSISLYCLDK